MLNGSSDNWSSTFANLENLFVTKAIGQLAIGVVENNAVKTAFLTMMYFYFLVNNSQEKILQVVLGNNLRNFLFCASLFLRGK